MKTVTSAAVLLLLVLVSGGFCARDVAFIGLTGQGAPAIEKEYTRLLQEQIDLLPDVHSLNSIEIDKLRECTGGRFGSTAFTPALARSLRRFVTDSALVVWGRVRECTVRPERFWVVGAGIRGTLQMDLTIYDFSNRKFIYIGDASATLLVKKWFVFLRPVDKAIEISTQERTQIIDKLENKSVSAAAGVIGSILLHEHIIKNKPGKSSAGYEKKEFEPGESNSPAQEETNPDKENQEPTFFEEEPADFELPEKKAADSSSVEKTVADTTAGFEPTDQ